MRYYIATALERAADHTLVRDAMAAAGHQITYDWTAHGSVQSEGLDRIREVAEAETRGVLDADLVIVLLPGGRGTHAELGIAIGAGIPGAAVIGPWTERRAGWWVRRWLADPSDFAAEAVDVSLDDEDPFPWEWQVWGAPDSAASSGGEVSDLAEAQAQADEALRVLGICEPQGRS